MNTRKLLALVVALAALAGSFVYAQDQNAPADGGGRRGKGGGRGQQMTPEARVEALDKALTLTEEQKTKIKDIYTKAGEEMRAAMKDGGGDREKMGEMYRKVREDVRAVLTDEQKKKFDEMPQRGGGDRGGRGKRGGGSNNN